MTFSSDPEMDSDFQFAILSSLESSHCPSPLKLEESKESQSKESRNCRTSRRKIPENSFENYWSECMEFNKNLKRKERKSKEKKSIETERDSFGMSDSQQSQI